MSELSQLANEIYKKSKNYEKALIEFEVEITKTPSRRREAYHYAAEGLMDDIRRRQNSSPRTGGLTRLALAGRGSDVASAGRVAGPGAASEEDFLDFNEADMVLPDFCLLWNKKAWLVTLKEEALQQIERWDSHVAGVKRKRDRLVKTFNKVRDGETPLQAWKAGRLTRQEMVDTEATLNGLTPQRAAAVIEKAIAEVKPKKAAKSRRAA